MKVNEEQKVFIDHCNIYYRVRPNPFERRKAATAENRERRHSEIAEQRHTNVLSMPISLLDGRSEK